FLPMRPRTSPSPRFPYTTLFRSVCHYTGRRLPPCRRRAQFLERHRVALASEQPGARAILSGQELRTGSGPEFLAGKNRACTRLRSEEHTSELQSRENLVCRLLLE